MKSTFPNPPNHPDLRTCRGCKNKLMPSRFCDQHRHTRTCWTCCLMQGPRGSALPRQRLSPIMAARVGHGAIINKHLYRAAELYEKE